MELEHQIKIMVYFIHETIPGNLLWKVYTKYYRSLSTIFREH